MKKQIDNRFVALAAVLVVIVLFFTYRHFTGSSSSGTAVTAQDAGLGKPVYPSIPSHNGINGK